jgi:hypothetical protein
MIRREIYLSIIFAFITVLLFADSPIQFYKEDTEISIADNTISVKGLYFFENSTDFEIDADVVYPFYVDGFNSFPEKITVLNPEDPLDFVKAKNKITFSLHFSPVGIETVSVEYSQTIKKKKTTYLLKKFWNDKTDKTSLVIETPSTFGDLHLSLEPDSVKTIKKKRFYYITKRFFQPKNDLKISWE